MDGMSDNYAASEESIRAKERQRICGELHRYTSQLLVALQLQVTQLRHLSVGGADALLNEMDYVLLNIHEEIRQIASRQSEDDAGVEGAKAEVARVFYSLSKHSRSTG